MPSEREDAIRMWNSGSAPSPGRVTFQALKSLGAIYRLLQTYNATWRPTVVVRSEQKDRLDFSILKHSKSFRSLSFRPHILRSNLVGKAAQTPCVVLPTKVSRGSDPRSILIV